MACSSWYRVESTWSSAARSPSRAASSHWVMSAVSAIKFPRGDLPTIYRMCAPGRSFLTLAVAAPYGAALADQGLFQPPAAAGAGFAAAAIGGQLLLEVSGGAVGCEEVAQGVAAAFDRR